MNAYAIFWPAAAQVALSLAVMTRMYVVRFAEMRARRISPQDVATSRAATLRLDHVAAADNFRNLFEVPVLYFVICPVLYVTGSVTPTELALAWAFVLGRCLHSVIHLTYNRVTHRFAAFIVSTLCVYAMWLVFAAQLWQATHRDAP